MVFPFAFFAGLVVLLAGPALPPEWATAAVALVAMLALCWRKRSAVALALCGAGCGWLFAAYHAQAYLDLRWPTKWTDERVIARVLVESIPAPRDSGWAFDARVHVEAPAGLARSLRVRLITRDEAFRPRAGETWRLLLALRPPRGRANPGTVDLERQLFRDGVHALGTVIRSSLNRRIDAGHRPLTALRERISQHIQMQVADRDARALIAALAVGDTGAVSREQWRIFNTTGTTHLVAISGLHVTLFAVVAFAVARRIWSAYVWFGAQSSPRPPMQPPPRRARRARRVRWPRWPRSLHWLPSCNRDTFAFGIGFFAAAAYATLAGLSVPTQRTLIMLGAWLLTRALARASRPFQPLALALVAVLLLDPFSPLSAGFWLSFAAMAAIILVTSDSFIRRPWWREAMVVQAAVTVALVPFTLALFGSVSVIGPLVNVVAIPAMSWVLVPTVLLSVVLLPLSQLAANAVLHAAAWLHDAGWPLLAAASDLPWALIHASPPWWWYPIALVCVAMALLPWPPTLRLAALVCAIPLATASDHELPEGAAEVTVLDVGESVSVVVRTSHHVLVYGTGDAYGTHGRIAESVLVPFLRSRGVREIDALVLPRASPAAGEGVTALLAELRVRQTLVHEPPARGEEDVAGGGDEEGVHLCAQRSWTWDDVSFEVVPTLGNTRRVDAAHACVFTVRAGGARLLIPGDSHRVSSAAFSDSRAEWLVVSGRRRVQREDGRLALGRLQKQGAQVLSTAEVGAVAFQIDAERGLVGPRAQRADGNGGPHGGSRRLWAASP